MVTIKRLFFTALATIMLVVGLTVPANAGTAWCKTSPNGYVVTTPGYYADGRTRVQVRGHELYYSGGYKYDFYDYKIKRYGVTHWFGSTLNRNHAVNPIGLYEVQMRWYKTYSGGRGTMVSCTIFVSGYFH